MEEYIVSALKYRPLNFDSVVGQRALTTTLKNAISSGKLAHAYLFCGPRGVGKTTCARIFAKAINCYNPQEGGEPCGECESCQAFDQQRSLNIHELDAASNNSVEDIRELCRQVLIPPQTGKYKVFIIDEVHMLSPSAFNAFLKTLEEPPSYVIFILCTTEKHKILPTILSRCQVYDFQRMTTKNTIDHLMYVAEKEGHKAEPEALALIAEKADGGMRDALSIFDQMVSFSGGDITYENVCKNLNVLSQEYYFQLVDHFLEGRVSDCLLLLNEVLQKGFDGGNFVAGLATHMRNLLVSRDAVTLPLLEMSEKMRARYQEQALRCPVRFVYKVLKLANDCDQAYRTSHNKRLQVELCLIQSCQASDVENADASGHSPAEVIKPIKKEEKVKPATATQPTPASEPAPVPLPKVSVPEEPKQQALASAPKKLPKVSFKHIGGTKKQEEAEQVQVKEPEEHTVEPINSEKLTAAWFAFIDSLPHESVALAKRFKGLQPSCKDEDTALLTVSNPQVQQTVEGLMPQILHSMRLSLKNHNFKLETRLEDVQEVAKSYSPSEMLKTMKKQNASVGELVTKLQLSFE
ncbi:MAG: DNA polymerase III subunit gamma/tau [Bacteroidaceae bacterium]|nr:DNA polymerase III subunit gamma/tau [Bacteroidaceae bacterium]